MLMFLLLFYNDTMTLPKLTPLSALCATFFGIGIEGSIAGLFLMGAGGHLRWVQQPQLRSMMNDIIDGIENCTEPDGYLAAFNQVWQWCLRKSCISVSL
jgi:hypothetical protein